MKYIFDFDDVLFHTTRNLKTRLSEVYKRHGLSEDQLTEYYEREKRNGFSLKKLINDFSLKEEVYEELMNGNSEFVNHEVLELVKKCGKENCYIVTAGDNEFQRDKIKYAGIENLFTEVKVALGSKKKEVEEICEKHKDETVLFIDDKGHYFDDLDFKKYPNLKTILYTGQQLNL